MTLVDAATTSRTAATSASLQEWALAKRSAAEQLAAIELVLVHDFDEPGLDPLDASSYSAQHARERFVIEATGIAQDHRTELSHGNRFQAETPFRAAA